MKKIIITVNLVLLSLLISGCGCSKKEEEKMEKITCISEMDDVILTVINYFDDDGFAISYKTIDEYIYSDENAAEIQYNSIIDPFTINYIELEGNKIFIRHESDYDENQKFTLDDIKERYSTYKCEIEYK